MNSKQRFRARIVLIAIVAGALLLGSRLYWTQVIKGTEFAARADKQYVKPPTTLYDRGSIYFSSKDGTESAAATISRGYTIFLNPKILSNREVTYDALSHYIKIDKDDFMKKAAMTNDPYEELLHKVDEKTAQSIKSLNLGGVGITKQAWRSYPGNTLAANTLGLLGQNKSGQIEGRYGLESYYENILKRSPVENTTNAFASLFSDIKDSVLGVDVNEGSIVTTIEPTVEKYLEKTLDKISTTWKSDEIGGIIINPQNGEIIAMASLPTFDPNDVSKVKKVSIFSNIMVEHVYEMGSILKPLTVAVGLDTKTIDNKWTYDDTGNMTLSGKKISNFDGKARGKVGAQEVLSQSLNVGAATIALEVGKENFSKYYKSFGLGSRTGIDQPNEATGIIRNLEDAKEIELATSAYGQGIAISPIAMTRVLSILGNGGYLVKPHLIKKINYTDGSSKEIITERGNLVIKEETAEEVTRMLVKVVDEALKKGAIKMERYNVAAKTGTAQIPNPDTKTYYDDRYLHSFFGYFPAFDAKFLVFLFHVNPKGAEYASDTLTEPFSEISKFLIDYYNIPPDR